MNLSEKIVVLRKSNGMSQEELAEKLYVSRQAVSRWEMGTAVPDSTNILQLGKLFHVTTDYLLNDNSIRDRYHSAKGFLRCIELSSFCCRSRWL